jgi:excisionase family DNA binding protein
MVEDDLTKPMLTVREVASLLNVHSNTVRRWSDRGILKAYRITHRGDRRFKRDDIINFLNELKSSDGDERQASLTRNDVLINQRITR